MEDVRTVLAEIQLLPGEISGKTRGYKSGVRPNHFFPGQESSILGVVEFEDREWLQLGQSCRARVKFLYPDWYPALIAGATWNLNEGSRHVGNGKVLEVLRDN